MENDVKKVLLTLGVMSEIQQRHKTFITEKKSQTTISSTISTHPQVWALKSPNVLTSGGRMNLNSEKVFAEFMQSIADDPNRGDCTMIITSGNDKFHQDKKKEDPNYDSKHLTGEAIDITTSPNCIGYVKKWLEQFKNYRNGFSYLDEYSKPSKKSSGKHFHLSFSSGEDPEIENQSELAATSSSEFPDSEVSVNYDEELMADILKEPLDKLTKPFREKLSTKLLSNFQSNSLSEQFNFGSGKIFNGNFIIPSNSGWIESPISGKILSKKFCENQILIKSDDKDFYILYCNVTDIAKHSGNVYNGTKLGTSSKDVEVTLLSNKLKKIKLGSSAAYQLLDDNNDDNKNKNKAKSSDDIKYKKEVEYYEPIVPLMIDLITYPFRKKNKKTNEEDINEYSEIIKNKKLKENLQRIKKLLN